MSINGKELFRKMMKIIEIHELTSFPSMVTNKILTSQIQKSKKTVSVQYAVKIRTNDRGNALKRHTVKTD